MGFVEATGGPSYHTCDPWRLDFLDALFLGTMSDEEPTKEAKAKAKAAKAALHSGYYYACCPFARRILYVFDKFGVHFSQFGFGLSQIYHPKS